jgi:hypothetical protein
MMIQIDGRTFKIVLGSNVGHADLPEGCFIELWDMETPERSVILDAFRSNADGRITVSMYRHDIPLEVLKHFLQVTESEFAKWPRQEANDAGTNF